MSDVAYCGPKPDMSRAFLSHPNGGLIVTASPAAQLHRELIISLAARHKLPAVYRSGISPPPAG